MRNETESQAGRLLRLLLIRELRLPATARGSPAGRGELTSSRGADPRGIRGPRDGRRRATRGAHALGHGVAGAKPGLTLLAPAPFLTRPQRGPGGSQIWDRMAPAGRRPRL